jgi:hypothetical protein
MRGKLAVGAVALAMAVAGCGGGGDDEKDSFSDAYKPLNADLLAFSTELSTAAQEASSKSDAQLASAYDGLAADLDAINDRLRKLDPPEDLKDELGGMTRDLDSTVGNLDDIATAARRHDERAARTATRELLIASARVNQNQNKLAEATGADKGSA